jgi:hypothetical protein
MKKFKYIFLALTLVFITSCEDANEIDQPGRLLAENAFQSVGDLQLGLLGVYNQMDLTPEISLAANFTDEVAIGFDSGGQGFALYDFVINAGTPEGFDFWSRNFRVNNRATLIIEAAEGITPDPDNAAEVDQYNNILAQLHFIRAYANFEMLIYFSPDPQDDSTLCVPLIDFVAPTDIQPLRNTTGEIWDFINSDVNTALSLSTVQSNPIFASTDAINALRARMALTRGNYAEAETLALDLLNSYGLANRTQYVNMFNDADNTEIIFKLDRVLNDGYDGQVNTGSVNTGGGWAGSVFAFVDATLSGSPYFEMDRSVFNALDPNDIRYDVNVAPSSVISADYENDPDPINNDILVIQKYPGSDGQPLMNDIKVFRSSEMLLIAAEARAYQGNFSGVEELLEQLRTARFGSAQDVAQPTSQQEAIGAVLDERKIELVYEGHRYKDLKRSGIAGDRGVDRDPIACQLQSGACTLSADDFRFTLPIPIAEINANPGIAEQQNPGYN